MPIPMQMRKERKLEKIAAAFAEAVAAGDMPEAEGWLAVARMVEVSEPDAAPRMWGAGVPHGGPRTGSLG